MKKFIVAFIAVFCLFSCEKTNYKIVGIADFESYDGVEGRMAYLYLGENLIDSTEIKNGKFVFKGFCNADQIANLCINTQLIDDTDEITDCYDPFILEKGTINVKINVGQISVSGTELNDALNEYVAKSAEFDQMYEKAAAVSGNEAEKVDKEFYQYAYEIAKQQAGNSVGKIVFLKMYNGMTTAQKEEITSLMSEENRQNEKIARVIANIEKEKLTAEGKQFIDFKLPTPKGDTLALSSLVGKSDYVLVDFWASWCPYCIKSFPALKQVYNRYNGKLDKNINSVSFEVLGVSLDNDKSKWTKAIEKFDLNWKQVSDLKGWQSEAAALYVIYGIPATILIDKEGKIAGRNLTIAEIDEFLSKK